MTDPAIPRPCLGCQRPTRNGARCVACARMRNTNREQQRTQQLGTRTQRGYDGQWYRNVKHAIAEQPWCSLCYATDDLTGDHILSRANGGSNERSNIQVLCRRCNAKKQ